MLPLGPPLRRSRQALGPGAPTDKGLTTTDRPSRGAPGRVILLVGALVFRSLQITFLSLETPGRCLLLVFFSRTSGS